MAYTNIDDPTLYFNTKLYTGTGSELALTGINFQPDLTWIKNRDTTDSHQLVDSVRGATKNLFSNLTNAEATDAQGLKSFDTDGFTVGTRLGMNTSGENYVGWSWLGGGTASSNTDGSITSSVSANTTSGFSIISYTGTGGTSQTLGHGLGVKPKMFIVKCRSNAGEYWGTWIDTDGDGTSNYRMSLNTTDGAYGNYPISFSNSLITLPSSANTQWDGSGRTYISYAFAEKKGYSKFGSYTGNGSTDGPMIVTGMKPALVIMKETTDSATNWVTYDNKRNTSNPVNLNLFPNLSNAESDPSLDYDFLSNGFKVRTSNGGINASGQNYIYMAWAESSFVTSTGIPTTAR